jgi:hypothetical protein
MRKASGRLAKEIEDLKKMKDEEIDLGDIPEITDWSKAVVGKFYRPRSAKPVSPNDGRRTRAPKPTRHMKVSN